jgi:hypothetical protein
MSSSTDTRAARAQQAEEPLAQAVETVGEQQDAHGGFTDARQLLAAEPVHHAAAAKARVHLHEAVGISMTVPMRAPPAQRVRAHGGQQGSAASRANGHQLALVGHVQRVQAQQFAGGGHLGLHGNVGLAQQHAHLRLARDFVERGGQAAARGVAQHMQQRGVGQRLQHRLHQGVQGRAVGDDGGLELQRLAQRHHRHAVLAQRARDQHRIARAPAAHRWSGPAVPRQCRWC